MRKNTESLRIKTQSIDILKTKTYTNSPFLLSLRLYLLSVELTANK